MTWSRVAWLLVVLAACENREQTRPQARPPERRVIEPPVGIMRPLPPYAIRADGVGPYRLGERMSDLLAQLPSGPRIALLEIPDVVHRSLIRAEEDDSVLIGGEAAGTATFVAVVGANVARTESGIHVGSTRAELETALGAPVQDPTRALDPRIVEPSGLRNARVILGDNDKIVAFVLEEPTPAVPAPEGEGTCTRPTPSADERGSFVGTCMSSVGERVEVRAAEIRVRVGESDKEIQFRLPAPIVFARPLRMPDGRDELAVITRADVEQQLTWALTTFRFEGTRLVKSVDQVPLYVLTPANARWIGAELRDIDLYLELTSRKDAIEVGGLLTTRSGDSLKDVVVISPAPPVARKHGKSAPPEGPSAGTTEGSADGSTLHDAGTTPRGARP